MFNELITLAISTFVTTLQQTWLCAARWAGHRDFWYQPAFWPRILRGHSQVIAQGWLCKVSPLDEKGPSREKMSIFPSRKDKPQKSQRRANQRHCARESLIETYTKLKVPVATENRRSYEAKARKLLKNVISECKLVWETVWEGSTDWFSRPIKPPRKWCK